MISRIVTLFARSMKRRLSSKKLDIIFRELPQYTPRKQTGEEITLCALQVEAKTYTSLRQWLRELDDILRKAAGQGARLICLPELYGLMPCFCHPAVRLALRLAKLLPQAGPGGGSPGFDLTPVWERLEALPKAYEQIMVRFARRYGVYLFGGTHFAPECGKLYNRGFLISPEGRILARQDKLHLTVEEMTLGLSPGEELRVVPTEIGTIALCVCMDATYFETFRIAKNLGADYIIVPIGDMAAFDPWLALRGAHARVTETGLTAVKPALVSGENFPILFTGKAGIYFPAGSNIPSREQPDCRGQGMVLQSIRLSELRSLSKGPFLRDNPGFARNYYEALEQYKEGESA